MSERAAKKKRKALKRAGKQAAGESRAQSDGTEALASPFASAETVAVDHLLRAYGELTDATVELYTRLDPQDARRPRVLEALAHAQQVIAFVVGAVDTETEADPETHAETDVALDSAAAELLVASGSVELVRTAPHTRPAPDAGTALDRRPAPEAPANLPVVVRRTPRRWLPDESFLARYARMRRATRRWPDEAALTRYLRERQLPDESGLRRFMRQRRERYLHSDANHQ